MADNSLENQITALNADVVRLRNEIAFLKNHSTLVRGMQGETLICEILNGQPTARIAGSDLVVDSIVRVEVKSSSLRRPDLASPRLRWQWSKPLGENNYGKDYNFLVLLGDKDYSFPNQYKDESPYVCFFIPRPIVPQLVTYYDGGAKITLSTNFSTVRNNRSRKLLEFMTSLDSLDSLVPVNAIKADRPGSGRKPSSLEP